MNCLGSDEVDLRVNLALLRYIELLNDIEEDWAQLDRAAIEVIETVWYTKNETAVPPAIVSSGKLGLPLIVTVAVPLDVNPKKLVRVRVMM